MRGSLRARTRTSRHTSSQSNAQQLQAEFSAFLQPSEQSIAEFSARDVVHSIHTMPAAPAQFATTAPTTRDVLKDWCLSAAEEDESHAQRLAHSVWEAPERR